LFTYKEHEKKSCEIMLETIDTAAFSVQELEMMQGMIMATKVPQAPLSLPEMILCDADLDYLGRNDFELISNKLKEEFLVYGIIKNDEEWDKLQVNFFESHHYFTASAINKRQALKTRHLKELKEKLHKSKL
jgi:predicted metal-dependent HD superfamily phosphohydrolase